MRNTYFIFLYKNTYYISVWQSLDHTICIYLVLHAVETQEHIPHTVAVVASCIHLVARAKQFLCQHTILAMRHKHIDEFLLVQRTVLGDR